MQRKPKLPEENAGLTVGLPEPLHHRVDGYQILDLWCLQIRLQGNNIGKLFWPRLTAPEACTSYGPKTCCFSWCAILFCLQLPVPVTELMKLKLAIEIVLM